MNKSIALLSIDYRPFSAMLYCVCIVFLSESVPWAVRVIVDLYRLLMSVSFPPCVAALDC